jgi:hypothetical protein
MSGIATVAELKSLALSPTAVPRYLSIGERSLSRFVADGRMPPDGTGRVPLWMLHLQRPSTRAFRIKVNIFQSHLAGSLTSCHAPACRIAVTTPQMARVQAPPLRLDARSDLPRCMRGRPDKPFRNTLMENADELAIRRDQ